MQPGKTIHIDFMSPNAERLGGMDMKVLALVPDTQVR